MEIINVGTTANDGTGDNLRAAMVKINSNFEGIHRENLIIDGQFNHWDHGVAVVAGRLSTMSQVTNSGNAGTGFTRGVFSLGQTDVPYAPKYFVSCNNVTSTTVNLLFRLDILKATAGKELTFSAWLRAASGSGDVGFRATQNFGSGGTPSGNVQVSNIAVTPTSIWTKYTTTFVPNSISGKTIGTDGSARVDIVIDQDFSLGTFEGTLEIANIALVYGSVAYDQPFPTPSEERHRIDEYYQIHGDYVEGVAGTANVFTYPDQAGTPATARSVFIPFRRHMRDDSPTITLGTPTVGTLDSSATSATGVRVNATSSGTSTTQLFDYLIADARL